MQMDDPPPEFQVPAAVGIAASEASSETHVFVGLNALLVVATISLALWLGHQMKKLQIHWLSDSGAAMLLGVFIGIVVNIFGFDTANHHLLLFDPELFFFILLPPIIFEAGFSMQKSSFFANLGAILLFAVFGTLLSTLVVGYGLFGLAKIGIVNLNYDSPIEALIFGSLISAVDPVAVLSILTQSRMKTQLLHSIIFGESVLNDAVSIVLFHTFRKFHAAANNLHHTKGIPIGSPADAASSSADDGFDHFSIGVLFLDFFFVSLGSLWIGVLVGLACSFVFKNTNLSKTPQVEFILLVFFAYAAYLLSEILGLSGIMSLFFCSIVIAHCAYHSLSPPARTMSKYSFKSFALVSETFLFAYLGLSAVISVRSTMHLQWSLMMIIFTMLLCLLARVLHIFPLSLVSNLCTRSEASKITVPMQVFLCFSSIRGAIAFALALNVFTEHRSVIISTTMALVVLTTVVFGGVTSPLLHRLKLVQGSAPGDSDPNSPDAASPSGLGDLELARMGAARRIDEEGKEGGVDYVGEEDGAMLFGSSIENGHHRRLVSSADAHHPDLGLVGRLWKDFDEHHLQVWFGGAKQARFHPLAVEAMSRSPSSSSLELYHMRGVPQLSSLPGHPHTDFSASRNLRHNMADESEERDSVHLGGHRQATFHSLAFSPKGPPLHPHSASARPAGSKRGSSALMNEAEMEAAASLGVHLVQPPPVLSTSNSKYLRAISDPATMH
jgi:sodium/hydrogen exchanger 8